MNTENITNLKQCFPETNKANLVYDYFHSINFKNVPIEHTGKSLNSFRFIRSNNENKKVCIERVFEINIPKHFPIDRNICVIHSSALAALLCFHKVDKNNPIKINGTEYDEVEMEWGNTCMEKGGKSKIDIALFNHSKKETLFLEAKFSEYLNPSRQKLKPIYETWYQNTYSKFLPTDIEHSKDNSLQSKSKKTHYCEGIKQMICHHIGARNYKKEQYKDYNRELSP